MPDPRTEEEEFQYLQSPRAIRERCEAIYELARQDELEHFALDEARLDYVSGRVVEVTTSAYPDLRQIPYHGRYRHFAVGGVDRLARLDRMLSGLSVREQLMARTELVITSVLLDAGAGARWSYHEADGSVYARSEGLGVASFDLFVSGALSANPNEPWRADASRLATLSEETLARAFQVSADNPLVGLSGRAALLRRLGEVVLSDRSERFGAKPRLGALTTQLLDRATDGALAVENILAAVLAGLGAIWPGREWLAGKNLGDVFVHSAVGRVPFHKLSQWLTYSLCEPLEAAGVTLFGFEQLTGLAEYRNGGLFIDAGVLTPKQEGVLGAEHRVDSQVVVEWRALTVALLDRTAERVRQRLGLTAEELPLARVLEGGTWRAGRVLASEQRAGGGPPLTILSDGTVF